MVQIYSSFSVFGYGSVSPTLGLISSGVLDPCGVDQRKVKDFQSIPDTSRHFLSPLDVEREAGRGAGDTDPRNGSEGTVKTEKIPERTVKKKKIPERTVKTEKMWRTND